MTESMPDVYTEGPPPLRTGLCQVYTEEWAVEENQARTLAALEEAADRGAELAITPECVLHGYGFADADTLSARLAEVAEPLDGPRIGQVRALARNRRMEIMLGFAERGENGAVHNAAALIDRDGEIVWVYRKVHCRSFETLGLGGAFTPGDRFYVSERHYGDRAFRIGAMICFDREVPEATRCVRSLGAELIACPLATNTYDIGAAVVRADNEMITRCRAAENELFIVVVNHAGRFNGGSFAVGPYGEVHARLGADAEVRVVDLPVGAVRPHLHGEPLGWMGWGYRRPEVYGRYLGDDKVTR